jgi:hypothetical protein
LRVVGETAEGEVVVRRTVFAICVAIGGFAATGTALAGPPAATTGAASAVTATTATLNGTVFANKESTTYRFEYGTTTAYGSQSPAGTSDGNADKAVSADITGLAPSTTYHFRLVATNASGTSTGADAQLTTAPAGAAAVTIAATPQVVTFGKPVAIAGQVVGRPGTKVELEQTPFPFTDPFKNVAQGTTDAAANYSFQVSPTLNTRYHVLAKSPPATSADVTVLVRTKVGLRLGDRTPRRGARVRFSGSVLPAHDGKAVRIQRRTSAGWKTIATPLLRAATPLAGVARSKYSKRIRIRRSGVYRTVMPADGDHARGKSRKRRATVH